MSTFYLKYRPQTIEDLDLTNVRNQLTSVLKAKTIPHAFLFSGSRGLGKTSAARILAKAINCETNHQKSESKNNKQKGDKNLKSDSEFADFEPCNQCSACISITKGQAVDVIEIDGASNRGIDDVRSLKESIVLAPLRLKQKVYVIDEVHMLTKEAFNALLKTLEEPPQHVLFILATTEPHKLPETIISRTLHIQFQKATNQEMKRSLERVIKGENLSIEDSVLDKIIQRGDGSFRDSVKMLEQLALDGKKIDENKFSNIFPQANVAEFIRILAEKDTKEALEWVYKQQQSGVNWEDTLRTILVQLKDELLTFYGIGTSKNHYFNQSELVFLINLCMQAGKQLKFALLPTLPLELLVVEWCNKNWPNNFNDGSQETGNKRRTPDDEKFSQKERKNNQPIESEETGNKNEKEINNQKLTDKTEIITQDFNNRTSPKAKSLKLDISLSDLQSRWDELLKIVRPSNFSVEALLRSAQPHQIKEDTVLIKVYYEFHKGRLETKKCLEIVEDAFEKIFAIRPKISYILGEKTEKIQTEAKKDEELVQVAEEIFS